MGRSILRTCLCCIGLLGCWGFYLWGEPPAPPAAAKKVRPPRPRMILQKGIDLYQKGEYESADDQFQQAEQAREQLRSEDQESLDLYVHRNNEALLKRYQALDQMQKIEEALKKGNAQEAETILKGLKANAWLGGQDQARVNELAEQVRQQARARGRWSPFNRDTAKQADGALPKKDAAAFLADAKKYLEQGNFEAADTAARQAQQLWPRFSMTMPWHDTPAKVLQAIQTERAKQLASKDTKPKNAEYVDTQDPKRVAAQDMLQKARAAAEKGDFKRAHYWINQAEQLKVNIPWFADTPARVSREIALAEEAATGKPTGRALSVKQASAPMPEKTLPAADVKAAIAEARKRLDAGDLEQAEELANKARLTPGIKYGLFEETPEKVLADVGKVRDAQNQEKAARLLAKARELMEQNDLGEAERLTYEAESLRPTYSFWHWGDRPDKLRAEIIAKKRKSK